MSVIRALSFPDLPRVLALERRAFTTPWSLSMFTLELAKPDGICLGDFIPSAGASGSALAGYLMASRYDEALHLMNLAVDPDRRGAGHGRRLVQALIDRAGADANITLEVRVSNARAIALYESFDFRGVGTRKRYYVDTGEDAMIMWRAIGAPWEAA